ncbi:transglycosylase domain-containing protein [Mucilaginibacter sp.]|uniref:transglycosylase domain-containing protein n=1 Tax=Mucilaginibacter sp. TaxID=1882438 RepID=UPI0026307E7F|nr:transglycosylase domain-containing protein [Mucilaginibacter sp.]MDB5032593.1 penicillin-binding protein [Mucilaginibacter sp.]
MDVKLSQQDIKRYNWYIWRFFIACFAFVIILITLTTFGVFGTLPSLHELENPKSDQASVVYSSDKQILGKYYVKNRSNVTYNQISKDVINALVAKEDNHFFTHSGVDFWRTFTIIPYNLLLFKKQGASTITQQLAFNLFSDTNKRARNPVKRVIQKLKELITAIRIEKHYTKEEIITMYLNTVDFGANTFGIKSAAQTYFNTTPAKLTADQAAVLIQMLTSTTRNSPIRHPDRAKANRDFVLNRMVSEGYLSEGQAAEYKAKPLGINYHPVNHTEGPAPYFRDFLKRAVRRLLDKNSIYKSDGTPYDLDSDGLQIYTTIDYAMQQYAEDAQRQYMRTLQAQFNAHWKKRDHNYAKEIHNYQLLIDSGMRHCDRYKELKLEGKSEEEIQQNFNTPDNINLFTWHGDIDTLMRPIDSIVYCKFLLRNSLMSMDPTTGYVKAWVGGINFEHFQTDQIYRGTRQVGSTAKPFTYAVAIENAYSPCMQVNNVPDTIYTPGSPPWCPHSGPTETIHGMLTLREALAHSQNWITAHIMKELTPIPVVDLIKRMGVTSFVPAYPSICIGSFDASVFDMTGAYSAFVNHGVWTEPNYLVKIEDKNGNIIYTNHVKRKQAMSEQTAYVMTYMLKGVIEIGTGQRLRWTYNLTNPIGGKTGTTNDNSDGWFIGITPQLVTGIWTGCEDRDIHFRTQSLGEGANSALPIFALYMKKVYADGQLGIKKNVDFTPPKDPLTITLDCNAYSQQQKGTNEVDKKLSF